MMLVAMAMGVFPISVPAVLLLLVLMVFVGILFGFPGDDRNVRGPELRFFSITTRNSF